MIFIGLDVSKISTSLSIDNNDNIKLFSYTTKKDNNTWVKQTNEFINYRHINYKYSNENDYSKKEILKLIEFDNISKMIIDDIINNINTSEKIIIGIEGYSYNSKGPIFDLIELTTLIKNKILNIKKYDIEIEIKSPKTLKIESCKYVYGVTKEYKGKKKIKEIIHIRDDKGKDANNFDKWDMFYSFIKSDINLDFKNWCINNIQNITSVSEVPKPFDDIIDSIFVNRIIKNYNPIF